LLACMGPMFLEQSHSGSLPKWQMIQNEYLAKFGWKLNKHENKEI
jgi:hypothetical protein